jgi:phosphatidylglycerophosphate synthase
MGDNDSDGNGKIIKFPSRTAIEQEYLSPPQTVAAPKVSPPKAAPREPPKLKSLAERVLSLKESSSLVRQAIEALPPWITPNAVTWFRMGLVVPIAYYLRNQAYWAALATAVVALSLDFVDGAIASVKKMQSESGAFLDPLADKVLIGGIILALADRLPTPIDLLGYLVIFLAIALTALRILKMAGRRRGPESVKGSSIAAKTPGKLKMMAETASVLMIIGGFALGVPAIVTAGGVALAAAFVLAGWSFMSQLGS